MSETEAPNFSLGRQNPSHLRLPQTVEELLAQRKPMVGRTLNDYVEDIHVKLWPNANYQKLLDAVYDEDAVEGSLTADNLEAAGMIREFAAGEGQVPQVAGRKKATIVKALNVVMRRYHMSRGERAVTLGGEPVSNTHNSGGGERG